MNKQQALNLAERWGVIIEERPHGVDIFARGSESLIKHFSDRDEAIPVDMWYNVRKFLESNELQNIVCQYGELRDDFRII